MKIHALFFFKVFLRAWWNGIHGGLKILWSRDLASSNLAARTFGGVGVMVTQEIVALLIPVQFWYFTL